MLASAVTGSLLKTLFLQWQLQVNESKRYYV